MPKLIFLFKTLRTRLKCVLVGYQRLGRQVMKRRQSITILVRSITSHSLPQKTVYCAVTVYWIWDVHLILYSFFWKLFFPRLSTCIYASTSRKITKGSKSTVK